MLGVKLRQSRSRVLGMRCECGIWYDAVGSTDQRLESVEGENNGLDIKCSSVVNAKKIDKHSLVC